MKEIDKELIRKLVAQIRFIAFRGQSDTVIYEGRSDKYMYTDDVVIYWQTVGQFLIVYIEAFGNDDRYYYQLYKSSGDAVYERKIVLNHPFESEGCRCLFSYSEDCKTKSLLYLHEDGIWYREFEQAVSEQLCE